MTNKKNTKKRLTKRQQKRRKRKILLIVEAVVLVVLIVVLAVYMKMGQMGYNRIGTIETNDDLDETILDDYTTIAFFGVDNRSVGNYDSGNSDSIMVCSINNNTKDVKIVSVYRDTFLDVDGEGKYRKCNYAYNHGGVEQALAMLNRNLDLDIQDYVAVDFNALVKAIDAVGGVEITLTAEEAQIMNDSYIGEVAAVSGQTANPVAEGTQTLDGVQATAYCRIRYTSGDDFKRAERQRTVLSLLVQKVQSASLGELNTLIDEILPEVSTSFTTSEILGLASSAASYNLVSTSGFPTAKRTATINKTVGSVVVPCTLASNVSELYALLYDQADYVPTQSVQDISAAIQSYTGFGSSDAVDYGY